MDMAAMITKLFVKNGMIFAFMLLGIIMFVAYKLGGLTKGRVHGSAIAIFLGLVLAYIGGVTTGGNKGIADIPLFAGMGLVAAPCSEISPSFPLLSVRISVKSRKSAGAA